MSDAQSRGWRFWIALVVSWLIAYTTGWFIVGGETGSLEAVVYVIGAFFFTLAFAWGRRGSKRGSIRTRDGAITDEGFVPEWELHPEKFQYYLVGNPSTRWAITKTRKFSLSFPWRWPRGGWRFGWLTFWWAK